MSRKTISSTAEVFGCSITTWNRKITWANQYKILSKSLPSLMTGDAVVSARIRTH